MPRAGLTIAGSVLLMAAVFGQPPGQPVPGPTVSVRVLFGLTDDAPAVWDGGIRLDKGAVKAIQGWRFGPEDSTDYTSAWKLRTRAQGAGADNVIENGVVITAAAPADARWSIHTPKGDFSFTMHDIAWGEERTFLDGAVAIDRVPPTAQLTTSDDDEDYPAAARSGDSIWVSFVRFSHSDRAIEGVQQMPQAPASFDSLARPAGGDQVFLMRYSLASGTWDAPVAVSPKGESVARTAIAVDREGRVWVFWSAERDDNFDLYARGTTNPPVNSLNLGPEVRLTSDAGPDLNPVATTDSNGRVWVAWQGFRNNNFEILTAVQADNRFSPETTVSFSPESDWEPSIAAGADGEVTVAWDTYDKGDYDVYFRRMNARAGPVSLGKPVAVAASALFEARPSIVYDPKNRLWVAWEVSPQRWGKNFGSYETTGTPLYEDHNIRVKCFEGDNAFGTSGDLSNVMPGPPFALRRARGVRASRNLMMPNPNMAVNRRPGQAVNPRNSALNSFPRLAADPAGGIYLAFRSLDGPFNARSLAGSIWFEHVAYFDGHNWSGPVFLPKTDGLLDNRPALVAPESGRLITISAMDHRQLVPPGVGASGADRINSDLYSADLRLDGVSPPAEKPELMKIAAERPAEMDEGVKEEREQVARMRNYRIDAGGRQLRILRGDFHRHTEYSVDGTRDGSLNDAWRYLIDAAALDWGACCDTDNGGGHEYFWWTEQKATEEFNLPGRFISLFGYERAVRWPEGHREILFAQRGIRPLAHLAPMAMESAPAPAPDTEMLYRYLSVFGGISVPQNTATDLGTDWRNNDPRVETAVEIYQGQRQSYEELGSPRAAGPGDAMNNWRILGTATAALDKGYRLGFVASSDHFSTHISYANAIVDVPTREGVMAAFRARHVYASTGNIIADVRSGDYMMGDEFTVNGTPSIAVKLIGSAPFARVVIVKDGQEIYSVEPKVKEVSFTWRDEAALSGKTSYYYVRGLQADGQLVWASPMWITKQ
jgi:hypothetical protein